FRVALLQFLEQPHVLNCDNGLVSEGFEKRDLLVSERTDFRPPNYNYPDCYALSAQWCGKYGVSAMSLMEILGVWKIGVNLCRKVMHVNRLAVHHGSAAGYATSHW